MANIFDFRNNLIDGYQTFSRSFTKFDSADIAAYVKDHLNDSNSFCPEPLIQINPSYAEAEHDLAYFASNEGARDKQYILHERCLDIFTVKGATGTMPLSLYHHQGMAILKADANQSYVVTSGTGSGKSLTFFIPMVSRILQEKERDPQPRIRAIIVYPMNALANSQLEEINKFLSHVQHGTVSVKRYTGQERSSERENLRNGKDIPDILLTNYMMLELLLLRPEERLIIENCRGLQFLVLDELHTYRGRQGSDVALLVSRLRQRVGRSPQDEARTDDKLICIGTSATMSSVDNSDSQQVVASFASKIFGCAFSKEQIINEKLQRETNPLVKLSSFSGDEGQVNCELLGQEVLRAAQGDFGFLTPRPQLADSLAAFKESRLAIWLEQTLSVELEGNDWRRARPMYLGEVVTELYKTLGADLGPDTVRRALINFMNFISDPSCHNLRTKLGRTPFAFKLHQFISGPGQLSTSLEALGMRRLTLDGRAKFVDQHATEDSSENKSIPAFEVRFCLHCGQEYLPVWLHYRSTKRGRSTVDTLEKVSPRDLDTTSPDSSAQGYEVKLEPGFVCPVRPTQKFSDSEGGFDLFPAEWRDPEDSSKLKRDYRKYEPKSYYFTPSGEVRERGAADASEFWVIREKFRLCVNCGELHQSPAKIHNRLIGLSGEGRSTASTTLTLLTLRQMAQDDLDLDKRKLLGFSDNRQDAALQAGHFNDFVKNLTIRSCLTAVMLQQVRADDAGAPDSAIGLRLDDLRNRMEQLLGWSDGRPNAAGRELFLPNPDDDRSLAEQALKDDYHTLRRLLSYYITRDLSERYFYTNPALEHLELLRIDYCNLDDNCKRDELFAQGNQVTGRTSLLTYLTTDERIKLFKLFLDELRRRGCLGATFLTQSEQENLRDNLDSNFAERWWLDKDDLLKEGPFICLDWAQSQEKRKRYLDSAMVISHRSRVNKLLRNDPLWSELKRNNPERAALINPTVSEIQDTLADMCQYLASFQILLRKSLPCDSQERYCINVKMLLWSPGKKLMMSGFSGYNAEVAYIDNDQGYFYRELYCSYAQDFLDFAAHSALTVHKTVESLSAGSGAGTGAVATNLPPIFSFEAHEHTAQLSSQERQELELRFRGGKDDQEKWRQQHPGQGFRRLPVLFCSPTMELGIDISALNFVYMRNVPPTAANYVQRAGRAGRSGQPSLVVTYCSARNAHDQWFFKNPQDMVQGVVREPTLDLTNDALLRAHLHSIWLSCALAHYDAPEKLDHVAKLLTGIGGDYDFSILSVPELKNARNDDAFKECLRRYYALKPELVVALMEPAVQMQATELGLALLENMRRLVSSEERALLAAVWDEEKVRMVMRDAARDFDLCFDYWRELYFTNLRERLELTQKHGKASGQRYKDVEKQLDLLCGCERRESTYSDFYLFRYLASQGFLPGYSFAAQPLLAWIPDDEGGSHRRFQRGDWLSRARFLGISEFGPYNLIYHNGRVYQCTRLKLSAGVGRQGEHQGTRSCMLSTAEILVCPQCGHYIWGNQSGIFNDCPHCHYPFDKIQQNLIKPLYQVSVVETRCLKRITMADEERIRKGFDVRTFYRFTGSTGHLKCNSVQVAADGSVLAQLSYGASSEILRANMGLRGHDESKPGFGINEDTGTWESKDSDENEQKDPSKIIEPIKKLRIIPYVRDIRNILIIDLSPALTAWGFDLSGARSLSLDKKEEVRSIMATLQAALARAITKHFQIELSEIFIEPLPNRDTPKQLLIYESGEGGSGVLNRLCQPGKTPTLVVVAEVALELMHYDRPDKTQPWSAERQDEYDRRSDCLGCYDCLLTYYNQPDHERINRQNPKVFEFLTKLTRCQLSGSVLTQQPVLSLTPDLKQSEFKAGTEQQQDSQHPVVLDKPAAPGTHTVYEQPQTTPVISEQLAAPEDWPQTVAESVNRDSTLLSRFRFWLIEEGYKMPTQMPWVLKRDNYALACCYKQVNCAVTFEPLPDKVAQRLANGGVTCLQLKPDGSDWAEVFAAQAERLALIDD